MDALDSSDAPVGELEQTDAMDALDTFDAVFGELILRQGRKAFELHKRIRDIIEGTSKNLPPTKVLYNDTYGGYSYSHAFNMFLAQQYLEKTMPAESLATRCAVQPKLHSGVEHRIRNVHFITQFGQHIMERWPGIAKLVKAYMRSDIDQRMNDIHRLEWKRKSLIDFQKRRDSIAAETGRSDGIIEWNEDRHSCLYGKLGDLSKYAPSALKAMCAEVDVEQNKLTLTIQEEHETLLKFITEAQYEEMLQSRRTKFPGEVEAEKALKAEPVKSIFTRYTRRSRFIDAITKYGEYHYSVWECQKHFGISAMRYLLLYPEHTERLASEGHNVDCALQLGLCAASNDVCHLSIAEVPCLREWTVNEYDGKETIDLL